VAQEEDNWEQMENQTILIEDDVLSQQIIEKIVSMKRTQTQIFDDFTNITAQFKEMQTAANSQIKSGLMSLDKLVSILRDRNRAL